MPSRKHDTAAQARYARMLELDGGIPYGSTDPSEAGKISRVTWLAIGGVGVASVVIVGGAFVLANQHPNAPREETSVGPFVPSATPSETETTASPSPSMTSASPSPSPSSEKPSPSDAASPTHIPSPTRSTHKVTLPSMETPSAPETHTSAPASCHWLESGGVVTVGDCGDHTAYNDQNLSPDTAHQLGAGMQFQNACIIGNAVRIEYGGSADYVANNGYFPVGGSC